MVKEKYERPELEITKFEIEDVITTSTKYEEEILDDE